MYHIWQHCLSAILLSHFLSVILLFHFPYIRGNSQQCNLQFQLHSLILKLQFKKRPLFVQTPTGLHVYSDLSNKFSVVANISTIYPYVAVETFVSKSIECNIANVLQFSIFAIESGPAH